MQWARSHNSGKLVFIAETQTKSTPKKWASQFQFWILLIATANGNLLSPCLYRIQMPWYVTCNWRWRQCSTCSDAFIGDQRSHTNTYHQINACFSARWLLKLFLFSVIWPMRRLSKNAEHPNGIILTTELFHQAHKFSAHTFDGWVLISNLHSCELLLRFYWIKKLPSQWALLL